MTTSTAKPEFERRTVNISDLHLDDDNPRLSEADSTSNLVGALVSDAKILEIAKDIAQHGLNPMDVWGVVAENSDGQPPYRVIEGNRRLCAIKLLHDPDLAPADRRKAFSEIVGLKPDQVHVVLFADRPAAAVWLERMHLGGADGRGRVAWELAAKQRHFGETGAKDQAFALSVVDYLSRAGLLPEAKKKGKLSVVERFVADPDARKTLGLVFDGDRLLACFDEQSQTAILERFAEQLQASAASGGLTTRFEKKQRAQWGSDLHKLLQTQGVPLIPTEPRPLLALPKKAPPVHAQASGGAAPGPGAAGTTNPGGGPVVPGADLSKHGDAPGSRPIGPATPAGKAPQPASPKPVYPKAPTIANLKPNKAVEERLARDGNTKLQLIYYDLCVVDLDRVGLITLGIWALLEALTSLRGRAHGATFKSFIDGQAEKLMRSLAKEEVKHIKAAVAQFHTSGNATKHSKNSGGFDRLQVATDWDTIQPLLLALLQAPPAASPAE